MIITPEQFAEVLCDDLNLNSKLFVPAVAQSIREQVEIFPRDYIAEEKYDQRVTIKVHRFLVIYVDFWFIKYSSLVIRILAEYSRRQHVTCRSNRMGYERKGKFTREIRR